MKKWCFPVLIFAFVLLAACSNEDNEKQTSDEVGFDLREVVVEVKDQVIHVAAEANSTEDTMYYQLVLGEEVIVEETKVSHDPAIEWEEFTLEIPIADEYFESDEVPYIHFYVIKDGEKLKPNYIPVEIK